MTRIVRFALGLSLACALAGFFGLCPPTSPAAAQTQAPAPSREAAMQTLLAQMQPGATLGGYLERLRQDFRQLDADQDGVLTAADADLHDAVVRAQMRMLAAMQILRADLDGDGVVTADEVRRLLLYERRTQSGASAGQSIDAEVSRLLAADKDHDGKITLAEAMNAAEIRPENRAAVGLLGGLSQRVRQLLTLSRSGDGKLSLADFEAAGTEQFHSVDVDGNGTISQDELNTFRQRQADELRQKMNAAREAEQSRQRELRQQADAAREAEQQAECAMPKASEAAKVVVLSAHRSEALARVGLGSQDIATGTGEIRIEPGAEPLYVVVISQEPTIWRLTGATDRIERLVAVGMTPVEPTRLTNGGRVLTLQAGQAPQIFTKLAAATAPPGNAKPVPLIGIGGLPAERVSVLTRAGCLKAFTEAKSSDAAYSLAAVRRASGKDPAVVAGRYNVGAFVLPSGEIRSAYDDKTQPRLTIVKEFGTLTLKGDTNGVVVRTGPLDLDTELAETSPGGVVDLDEKTVVASAPVVRYTILPGLAGLQQLQNSGALSRTSRGEFVIHGPIRFPAGLAGHAVKFLLLRDVPMPEGDPGDATLISEETGMVIDPKRH
jgi:Ca2+-binding EF-hand superfamily protein